MKTFIPDIDDANIRIAHLETKLGREPSGFVECIDTANQRIEDLEAELLITGSAAEQPAVQQNRPATKNLTGIRRAIAANGGPALPTYRAGEEPKKGDGIARAIAANARHQS